MTITIPYPHRKDWAKRYGLNAYWAGKHWAQRKEDADFWHYLVRSALNRQGIYKLPYKRPVEITFTWNDRLDIDNHAAMGKMIVDALKGWVIADDSRKYYARCVHQFGRQKDIIVTIEEVRE